MDQNNSGYFNLELPENKPIRKKEERPLILKIIIWVLIAGAAIIVLPIVFCLFVALIYSI